MLELYHAEPVANSMKVLVCLAEKQQTFESHYVNLLLFEQHSPQYLAINPDGVVPTLVHDGVKITESSVINEYLDEVFPDPPLKPASALARSRMRIWIKYVDDYFGPAASRIGWHFLLHPVAARLNDQEREQCLARIPLRDRREKWATVAGPSFTAEQLAEARDQMADGARRMEATLRNSQWMAGESYSLADIASYGVVPGLARFAPELMNATITPRMIEWLDAMNERAAVKASLAMPNNVPETLKALGIAPRMPSATPNAPVHQ